MTMGEGWSVPAGGDPRRDPPGTPPSCEAVRQRSRQMLLAKGDRARAGLTGLHLGPVALRAAADQAQADARRMLGLQAAPAADAGGELIACADQTHLCAILRHLILAGACAAPAAALARVDVEASCGEARLVVHALAGVRPDELAAVDELIGAMGGQIRISGGPAPSLWLVLRGLPCAAKLRSAA